MTRRRGQTRGRFIRLSVPGREKPGRMNRPRVFLGGIMPFDFRKEYKENYMPKSKPEIVDVPKANYIAVRGKGNPNEEGGAYQKALGVLYAVAYTLKMSSKSDYKIKGFFEYVVPPLEGFWWQGGANGMNYDRKDLLHAAVQEGHFMRTGRNKG